MVIYSDFIQPLNLPFCLKDKARSATWKVFNSFMSGVAMYGRIDLTLVSRMKSYAGKPRRYCGFGSSPPQ